MALISIFPRPMVPSRGQALGSGLRSRLRTGGIVAEEERDVRVVVVVCGGGDLEVVVNS